MKKTTLALPTKTPASPLGRFNNRGLVLLAGAILTLLLLILWSGYLIVDIIPGLAVDGSLVLLWFIAAGLLGQTILRLLRIDLKGALGAITSITLGLGIYSLAGLGLGLAGRLNRTVAIAFPIASAAIWACARGRQFQSQLASRKPQIERWLQAPAGTSWLLLLAAPALSIALGGASMFPGFLWNPLDPHPYDVMSYHLEVQREWYEAGRIIPLHHNVYSFFPANMETQYLLGSYLKGGPWKAMYYDQLLSFGCMVLMVLGIWALVRNLGGNGVIAALLASAVPWVTMLGATAYVESVLLLDSVLALAWLIRALQSAKIREAALAGAFAGLACGVKYTAAPTVLVLLPAAAVIAVLLYRPWRSSGGWKPRFLGTILFGLVGTATFLPWMARNVAWTGNPFFPLEMKTLGQAHFDAIQVERWDRAHRPPPAQQPVRERLKAGWREVVTNWQYGYVILPLGLLAALFTWRKPIVGLLLLILLFQAIFWLFFTHLMGRFAVMIIPTLAILAGLATRRELTFLLTGGSILAIFFGLFGLLPEFVPRSREAQAGLYFLTDWSKIYPDQMKDIESTQDKIALIGIGEAFYYRIPINRILYRSVFDTRFPPGTSVIDGWLGQSLDQLRKDYIVEIHYGELRRLSRTYYAIPPLPPEDANIPDTPVVLPKRN